MSELGFSTYFWIVVYILCTFIFFVVASWVIVRGGKDVWEMLNEARINSVEKSSHK